MLTGFAVVATTAVLGMAVALVAAAVAGANVPVEPSVEEYVPSWKSTNVPSAA